MNLFFVSYILTTSKQLFSSAFAIIFLKSLLAKVFFLVCLNFRARCRLLFSSSSFAPGPTHGPPQLACMKCLSCHASSGAAPPIPWFFILVVRFFGLRCRCVMVLLFIDLLEVGSLFQPRGFWNQCALLSQRIFIIRLKASRFFAFALCLLVGTRLL